MGVDIVENQLKEMATGGIHDHLGGGFHRYTVDIAWQVPHFEKMLYDQAQILALYCSYLKMPNLKPEIASYFKGVAEGIAGESRKTNFSECMDGKMWSLTPEKLNIRFRC